MRTQNGSYYRHYPNIHKVLKAKLISNWKTATTVMQRNPQWWTTVSCAMKLERR